ncbi:MAG TPA: PAS domain-containing protein, partial [Candidatus Limnocylindrales bacterium]
VVTSADGWIVEANATARDLLGIEEREVGARHFTDFVEPGTLDDSIAMFQIVSEGNPLTATVLLRPSSGDTIAIDIHTWREAEQLVALFRLADDVEAPGPLVAQPPPAALETMPATDAAFRGYAELALSRMPEPTVEGLALRLRRLYPHARIEVDGDRWVARRDGDADGPVEEWWSDSTLPRVRYDAQALILEANRAAEDLLGRSMIGHYWQEFVTPGSTEQVSAMLAILAEVGRAESRFRMPRADGSLLEFDSWTEVDGEGYMTVMRPRTG